MKRLDHFRKFLFEDSGTGSGAWAARTKSWLAILYHAGRKSWQDNVLQRSAALSFFTLLNLFPLAGILLFILSHSSFFHENMNSVEKAIIRQLVTPAARQLVENVFAGLSRNLSVLGTSLSGIVTLLILFILGTSLILLVERSLNAVFRSSERKGHFFSRLAFLWTIMTLLPVILGFSLALTSQIQRQYADWLPLYRYLLPYVITLLGFMVLYRVVPKAKIKLRIVFFVSLFFGVLWELAKVGLGKYVDIVFSRSPVHQLYGSMALVPIVMVWIYYSWVIVLMGAEFAYVLQNYEKLSVESKRLWLLGKGFVPLSRRVALSMVLEAFRKFSGGSGGFCSDDLTSRFQVHPEQSARWFEALADNKFIVITEADEIIPAKPLESITVEQLSELYEKVFEGLLGEWKPGSPSWKESASDSLGGRTLSLKEILSGDETDEDGKSKTGETSA